MKVKYMKLNRQIMILKYQENEIKTQTDRQPDKPTDRQTYRPTDRQADRQTDTQLVCIQC